MPAIDPSIVESTLLCEDCGYVIESVGEGGVCPECGRPVADSLPSRRTGTPYQSHPGIRTWLGTLLVTIRHPVGVWGTVVIGGGTDNKLLFTTLIAAAIGVMLPPAALVSLLIPGGIVLVVLFAGPLSVMAITLVLYWLTRIEEWGIGYFGSRRGWRLTPAVARTITAHAAVGWLAAALLFWPLMLLNLMYQPSKLVRPGVGAIWPLALDVLRSVLPFLGAFIGLLMFEVLVYIGMRRCRFANQQAAPTLDPALQRLGVRRA
ncbi:MAG: hypothetical protein ACK4WH_11820 [Phycisphaerales bacterium]